MTFWTGYLRSDGSKGIRDWILVVHTVKCARFTAEKIASGEENVCCIGYDPCNDNDYAIRLLLALSRHPNAGGALFVGLGCEYTQPRRLAEVTEASGRPADWFFIQDTGGTLTAVAEGKRRLGALKERVEKNRKPVAMGWQDLAVGCECGGSDATSGLAGTPGGAFFRQARGPGRDGGVRGNGRTGQGSFRSFSGGRRPRKRRRRSGRPTTTWCGTARPSASIPSPRETSPEVFPP